MTDTVEITEAGCFLDNHRGHYITRDMIELAQGWGFIVGPFEQFAIDMYDSANDTMAYPQEALIELADHATEWLNSGQEKCPTCHGEAAEWGMSVCKTCSNTGRGNRIKGQNFPPKVPDGCLWEFNDGDFGLYWRVFHVEKHIAPMTGACWFKIIDPDGMEVPNSLHPYLYSDHDDAQAKADELTEELS